MCRASDAPCWAVAVTLPFLPPRPPVHDLDPHRRGHPAGPFHGVGRADGDQGLTGLTGIRVFWRRLVGSRVKTTVVLVGTWVSAPTCRRTEVQGVGSDGLGVTEAAQLDVLSFWGDTDTGKDDWSEDVWFSVNRSCGEYQSGRSELTGRPPNGSRRSFLLVSKGIVFLFSG